LRLRNLEIFVLTLQLTYPCEPPCSVGSLYDLDVED
jgi:hypothetical protein